MTSDPEILLPASPCDVVRGHEADMLLPPPHPIPSGHWWAFLPGSGEHTTTVNDHMLYWPRGHWFVVEDRHFHALMDTDFPMRWLEGWDEYEKTFETRTEGRSRIPLRVISKRRVRQGSQIDARIVTGRRADMKRLPGG